MNQLELFVRDPATWWRTNDNVTRYGWLIIVFAVLLMSIVYMIQMDYTNTVV